MRTQRFIGAAWMLALLVGMSGCGGGGGGAASIPTGGGGRSPAIAGAIGVTGATASRIGIGRALTNDLAPVSGATIELHRIDPANPAADDPNARSLTTTDGSFTFYSDELTVGAAYRIEGHGTLDSSQIDFETLASIPEGATWSTPLTIHVTEMTTVATSLVERQLIDLARDQADYRALGDLQGCISFLIDRAEEHNLATPDVTRPTWLDDAATQLEDATRPFGSLIGTYKVADSVAGTVAMTVVPDWDDPDAKPLYLVVFLPYGADQSPMPAIPNGGNSSLLRPGDVNPGDGVQAMVGRVDSAGLIRCESADGTIDAIGSLTITGGHGTWVFDSPQTHVRRQGTWEVGLATAPIGAYGGTIADVEGHEGYFAGVVTGASNLYFACVFGDKVVLGQGPVVGGECDLEWWTAGANAEWGRGWLQVEGWADSYAMYGSLHDSEGYERWYFDASTDNPFPFGLSAFPN